MQNVPKIVRERLKAATPPGRHPDANLLTAFAERSLGEDQRGMVLDHLARCGDCRDIVALALPASDVMAAPVKVPARGWLTWPILRWGFVAAGVVAIAALGVVEYQRRTETAASNPPAPFSIAAKEAKNQPLAAPGPAAASKKADNQSQPASAIADSIEATDTASNRPTRLTAEAPRPTAAPRIIVGESSALVAGRQLAHGPRMANQWQRQTALQNQALPAAASPVAQQQAAGDLSANLKVPTASQTVTVENQTAQLDTQAQDLNAIQIQDRPTEERPRIEERQSKDQPAEPQSDEDDATRVGKAKPAEPAPSGRSGAVAHGATIGGPLFTSSAQAPRWTINANGGLQRSFDQGATWQSVDVNANPASFTDATSIQIVGKTSRAKVQKVPSPIFRAVAATGADVWAGGSGGALYHSSDAGNQWTRIMPAASGAILTGDVVSVEFIDLRHGKVSTSVPEVWTTSDAGQTWQKQ
jgi:Photosynthesis system II assembly factor YCF48